jgi:hypothetical protein
MNLFLSGIALALYWTAALFFFRFWSKTSDRLFGVFGLALWLLGFERLFFIFIPQTHESRPYVYLVRLLVFVLILIAIVDKNVKRGEGQSAP